MKLPALLTTLLTAMAVSLGAQAATYATARDAFVNAPQGTLLLLTKNDRLDMLDYYDSGQKSPVTNALDGKSRITGMTDSTLDIAMTPSSDYTIALLPGDVIALIVTLSTPARDSRVTFYSANDWSELDNNKLLAVPGLSEWLTKKGQADRDLVEGMVPFIMARYAYDPATSTLTMTNDLKTFLSPDIYEMIADDIKPALVYRWNGRKFTLQP